MVITTINVFYISQKKCINKKNNPNFISFYQKKSNQ
eukprot:UN14574